MYGDMDSCVERKNGWTRWHWDDSYCYHIVYHYYLYSSVVVLLLLAPVFLLVGLGNREGITMTNKAYDEQTDRQFRRDKVQFSDVKPTRA